MAGMALLEVVGKVEAEGKVVVEGKMEAVGVALVEVEEVEGQG